MDHNTNINCLCILLDIYKQSSNAKARLRIRQAMYIHGVEDSQLSFQMASHPSGSEHGVGIYANGALEALYTGGDLSVGQITQMTSADNSAAAMANQMWCYWGENTTPALLA